MKSLAGIVAVLVLSSCGAARGTYFLVDAEQKLQMVRETNAPQQAIYHWTMAEEHMMKAYEEWGYSDFEMAEKMSLAAVEWADRAQQIAAGGSDIDNADQFVPEQVENQDSDSQEWMRDDELDVPVDE